MVKHKVTPPIAWEGSKGVGGTVIEWYHSTQVQHSDWMGLNDNQSKGSILDLWGRWFRNNYWQLQKTIFKMIIDCYVHMYDNFKNFTNNMVGMRNFDVLSCFLTSILTWDLMFHLVSHKLVYWKHSKVMDKYVHLYFSFANSYMCVIAHKRTPRNNKKIKGCVVGWCNTSLINPNIVKKKTQLGRGERKTSLTGWKPSKV